MKEIEAIKAALAAGPTPGPWIGAGPSFGQPLPVYLNCVVPDYEDDELPVTVCDNTETADANYIAACNPAAMQKIIDHIDAQGKPVAWIVFAEVDGEMVPQHPARGTKLGAETDASMYAEGVKTEVRALYTDPQPRRKPRTIKEIEEDFLTKTSAESKWANFVQGVRAAERHHGIKP